MFPKIKIKRCKVWWTWSPPNWTIFSNSPVRKEQGPHKTTNRFTDEFSYPRVTWPWNFVTRMQNEAAHLLAFELIYLQRILMERHSSHWEVLSCKIDKNTQNGASCRFSSAAELLAIPTLAVTDGKFPGLDTVRMARFVLPRSSLVTLDSCGSAHCGRLTQSYPRSTTSIWCPVFVELIENTAGSITREGSS